MRPARRDLVIATVLLGMLAVAVPALAANPSGPRQAGPDTSPAAAPNASDKPGNRDRGDETPVTVTGRVTKGTDDQGRPTFAISGGGKVWSLSAGPPWFFGDDNPLEAFVGTSVTVVGSTRGNGEVDVATIDGKPLREGGKPPWAGGPWVVGETHPGWKDWMADGKPGKGLGRENAPGQVKKAGE